MPFDLSTAKPVAAAQPAAARRGFDLSSARPMAPSEPAPDPSAGGGTLQFGPWDTGIRTPQTFDRTVAGIGQGMHNVWRNLGNIVGLVDDEDLAEAKQLDRALLDTTAGSVGSFLGEMAATAAPAAGAASGVARLGARLGGPARSLLGNALTRGAVEGATHGAIVADPGDRAAEAAKGGALGTILPAALMGGRKFARGVTRTPAAQALLERGVDLTPGQMNPGGMLNQFEEAWQSAPVVGPVISGARDNARATFQRAAIESGAAPGARITQGDPADMLDAAYRSFDPLYAQARGFDVTPAVRRSTVSQGIGVTEELPLGQLFEEAAMSPGIRATRDTRESMASWLGNQITQLDGTSDGLLQLRSAIRAELRATRTGGAMSVEERAAAQILEQAERAVTEALESQLPAGAMQAVRTADSAYGRHKVVEDAVARAGDQPGGFTPAQLSGAVRRASERGTYARGGGGELRDLAAAGRQTLDMRSPPTGARLAAIGIPVATAGVGTAVPLLLAGTQIGRRVAAGATKPQRALGVADQALLNSADPMVRELIALYARRAAVEAGVRD